MVAAEHAAAELRSGSSWSVARQNWAAEVVEANGSASTANNVTYLMRMGSPMR
jgi:hypothetical protein